MNLFNDTKAFLFDLDGVLLDSEGLYTEFWRKKAIEYNIDIKTFTSDIKGKTIETILCDFFPKDFHITIRADFYNFEKSMPFDFFKGALDTIIMLRKSFKVGLVTSSDRIKMTTLFSKVPGFVNMFDGIMDGEKMTKSKPAPDCWLEMANQLNVDIQNCVVVEDSINGLISAQSSGAFVIGVTTSLPQDVVSRYSHCILDNVSQIIKMMH